MEVLALIISLIILMVFFVMSSNIASLKKLTEKQVEQNAYIITLLKINTPSDKLKEVVDDEKNLSANIIQDKKPRDKFGRSY